MAKVAAKPQGPRTIADAERMITEARHLFSAGRPRDARKRLQAVESAFPRDPEVLHAIALAEIETGDMRQALLRLRRVVQLTPQVAEAHYYLGLCLFYMGRLEEAIAPLRKATELNADLKIAWVRLAGALANLGRFDEAVEVNRRILTDDPHDFGAYNRLAMAAPDALDESDIARMEELARSTETPDEARAHLASGLSELFDRRRDYDAAFRWLKLANDLKAQTLREQTDEDTRPTSVLPPDEDHESTSPEKALEFQEEAASLLRTGFTPDAIERFSGLGHSSATPILIVGMPRCGSTLVEQILSAHPQVKATEETPALSKSVGMRELRGFAMANARTAIAPDFPEDFFKPAGRAYVERLVEEAGKAERITDKQLYNYYYVGMVHLMLPNATILHVRRNPVDHCLACYRRLFQAGNEYTYDLETLGRYYVGYRGIMDVWDRVLPGRVVDVVYEDLVSDPETQARRIVEASGLKWNNACLRFYESRSTVRTASFAQVRQPIYTTSVERWRRYEKHIEPLLDALGPYAPERAPAS